MNRQQARALDRHITGNWGEESFFDDEQEPETPILADLTEVRRVFGKAQPRFDVPDWILIVDNKTYEKTPNIQAAIEQFKDNDFSVYGIVKADRTIFTEEEYEIVMEWLGGL